MDHNLPLSWCLFSLLELSSFPRFHLSECPLRLCVFRLQPMPLSENLNNQQCVFVVFLDFLLSWTELLCVCVWERDGFCWMVLLCVWVVCVCETIMKVEDRDCWWKNSKLNHIKDFSKKIICYPWSCIWFLKCPKYQILLHHLPDFYLLFFPLVFINESNTKLISSLFILVFTPVLPSACCPVHHHHLNWLKKGVY